MFWGFVSFLNVLMLLAVVAIILYRGLYREYPFFFSYLLVVLGGGVLRRVFLDPLSIRYFYIYWATEAVYVIFGFLVLYEVLLIRLFPRFNITVIYRWLFPLVGVVVVLLTAVMFMGAPS